LTVFQLMNEFHHLPVFNVDFHCNICRVLDQIDLCQAMFAYYGASRLKSEAGNFCGPWCNVACFTFLQNSSVSTNLFKSFVTKLRV